MVLICMGKLLAYGLQRRQSKAECGGTAIEVVDDALAVTLLVVVLAPVDVFGSFGQHGVDEAGQFVGGGGNGLGFVESPGEATVVGTESRLTSTQGKGCHAQGLSQSIRCVFRGTREYLATRDLGTGAQSKPRGKVLGALEAGQVRTNLRDYFQGGGGLDAVDVGEINTAGTQQRRAQIKPLFARPPALALWCGRRIMAIQAFELRLNLNVASRDGRTVRVVQGDGLLEGEQVLFAPITLERLDNIGFAGANTLVSKFGEFHRITLTRND